MSTLDTSIVVCIFAGMSEKSVWPSKRQGRGIGDKLTERQRTFCQHYAETGNGSDAARKAGYGSPETESCRLLKHEKIKQYLATLMKPVEHVRIAGAAERHAFWTSVMLDPKAKMNDRLKASELLGRCQGDFIERLKLSNDADAPLSINVTFVDPE